MSADARGLQRRVRRLNPKAMNLRAHFRFYGFLVVTFLLALLVWHMPLGDGTAAYLYGSATGVWNVDWITFWGVMLFNTLAKAVPER